MTKQQVMTVWACRVCEGGVRGRTGPQDYGPNLPPDCPAGEEFDALTAEMVERCFAAILQPAERHQWRQAQLDRWWRHPERHAPCPWIPETWRKEFWRRVCEVAEHRDAAARISGDR